MSHKVEIYVRQSAGRNYLNFHVSNILREKLLASLKNGAVDSDGVDINLELSILPEWITDEEQRARFENQRESMHIRVPVSAINTYFED